MDFQHDANNIYDDAIFYHIIHRDKTMTQTGLQLRKSEQNGIHDNFLISQPNPMM